MRRVRVAASADARVSLWRDDRGDAGERLLARVVPALLRVWVCVTCHLRLRLRCVALRAACVGG